jgi:hypothetical protein
MDGVSYDWTTNGEKSLGFIAQDMRDVLPEIVMEDRNGYLSIDYSKVTPVLVNAIKEQQAQIDALKNGGVQIIDEVASEFFDEVTFHAQVIFEDATVFMDDVTLMKRVVFGDMDVAGSAIIEKGKEKIEVKFEKEFVFIPYVTATANNAFEKFIISEVDTEGFAIEIEDDASRDMQFTWHALATTSNFQIIDEEKEVENNNQSNEDGIAEGIQIGDAEIIGLDEEALEIMDSQDEESGI